ncbi:MAG: PilZ domain-containing protein [Candidatus Omnitrophica bacterium]|nr:PilZ domain-containing protein [Candidatus Omnitrophota bacterium]
MPVHRGPNRRKYRRLIEAIGVNIISLNKKSTLPKLDEEVGLNIGEGGALLECSKNIKKGALLVLKIMLDLDFKYVVVEAPAKVVWTKKTSRKTYYLGCKFTRLKPKDRIALKRFSAG